MEDAKVVIVSQCIFVKCPPALCTLVCSLNVSLNVCMLFGILWGSVSLHTGINKITETK